MYLILMLLGCICLSYFIVVAVAGHGTSFYLAVSGTVLIFICPVCENRDHYEIFAYVAEKTVSDTGWYWSSSFCRCRRDDFYRICAEGRK